MSARPCCLFGFVCVCVFGRRPVIEAAARRPVRRDDGFFLVCALALGVAERGEEHKAQLCPPGSVPSGSIIVRLTTSPVPPLVARQDTTSVGTLKASATRFTTCCHDSQGNTHCDADGSYSTVRGFAHALCKSELKDCDDKQRPDPNMGEPTAATAGGARDL